MARLRYCIVLLALLAVCAAAPSAGAVSDEDLRGLTFRDEPGFRTLLVDTRGEEHWRDGVLDAAALEESEVCGLLASYHLYYEDETVLDVELRCPDTSGVSLFDTTSRASNGYYAVQFDVYDKGVRQYCQAFITGLTDSNLSSVQSGLISARQNGTAFDLTHVDFIDAEKMDPNQGGRGLDSEMCWAAACSNLIHYTGWAARADEVHNYTGDAFTDGDRQYYEDRLFNSFTYFFSDAGGSASAGLTWFFSGINPRQGSASSARVDNGSYGSLAGFLYPYAPDPLIRESYITGWNGENHCQDIVPVLDRLREGWGCALGLGWYYESGGRYYRDGGHAITLWGYIRKKTIANDGTNYLSSVDPNDYVAFLVTDSDSDKYGRYSRGIPSYSTDAGNAPNRLQLHNLSYVGYTDSKGCTECTWQLLGYTGSIGLVEDFTVLRPCSSDIPQEDWSRYHGDRFDESTPEIAALLRISDQNDIDGRETTVFRAQDGGTARVNLFYGVKNTLYDWTASHSVQVSMTLKNSSGQTVLSKTSSADDRKFRRGGCTWRTENLDLPGGEYTATVTVSLKDGSPEAFYTNNTFTQTFTVIDAKQRVFSAQLTGAYSNSLRVKANCPEPFEYARLAYGYYLEDGSWSGWTWGSYVDSADGRTFSIPARQADWVRLRLDCHREYQNYVLLSDWIPISFTAALDAGGGTVSPASFKTYAGLPYGALPTPARLGYRFDGWFTADGEQVTENTIAAVCADETFYAGWTWALPPGGGALSAHVSGTVLEYEAALAEDAPACLLLTAYDSDGQMTFLRMLPDITTGTGFLSVPSADRYKAFLVHSGSFVPLCPAWSSEEMIKEQIAGLDIRPAWKKELFYAVELGVPMAQITEETISGAEMMELLDWFVAYAAPEKLDEWKDRLPLVRGCDDALCRFDAMAAWYLAARTAGGDYLGHIYSIMQLQHTVNHSWDENYITWDLFGGFDEALYQDEEMGACYLDAACYYYNLARASYSSREYPFALDPGTNSFTPHKAPSYAEGVLAVVRLISSADPGLFPEIPSEKELYYLGLADTRRKEIAEAVTDAASEVTGTVYYVSNRGSDDNDGRSPESPWATPQHAFNQALLPGDAVLLERGGVWTILPSGRYGLTSSALEIPDGVTLGAWGKGEKPVLTGAVGSADDAAFWTLYAEQDGAKIWKAAQPVYYCPVIVFNDGEAWASPVMPDMDGSGRYLSESGGVFDAAAGLGKDLQFCCLLDLGQTGPDISVENSAVTGALYLRCDGGNPAEVYETVSLPQTACGLVLRTDASVRGVALRYFTCNGAVMDGYDGFRSQSVSNCEVGWCGGLLKGYNKNDKGIYEPFDAGGALQVSSSGVTVTDSYLHHCGPFALIAAVHNNSDDPASAILHFEDLRFAGNLFEYCGCAVHMGDYAEMDVPGTSGYITNLVFEDNLVMNSGTGRVRDMIWRTRGRSSGNLSAIENCDSAIDNDGIFIRNNLFCRSSYALFSLSDYHLDGTTPVNAQPVFSGNIYVQPANLPLLQKNWSTEVYYPSEQAMQEVLGDGSGTLVILE